MKGKIVLDIVFKGRSLNYDQGTGNLQELKKIVMPNGKTHTLVSKYALRYSILREMDGFAPPEVIEKEGDEQGKEKEGDEQGKEKEGDEQGKETKKKDKQTIHPSFDALKDGRLFEKPEFVLFGFLIASKDNKQKKNSKNNKNSIQIQRENPTKITHAISLTPFEGDVLMYGNHGFAARIAQKNASPTLDINIFNKEEHEALYAYNIVIDLDQISHFTYYTNEKIEPLENDIVKITVHKVKKEKYKVDVEFKEEIVKQNIKRFLETVFTLKRNHQGETKSIEPIVAIVQRILEGPYNTYLDQFGVEENYEEEMIVEEDKTDKGTKTKVIRKRITNINLKVPKITEIEDMPYNEYKQVIEELLKDEKRAFKVIRNIEGINIK